MHLRPYGPSAWLVDGLESPAGWAAAVVLHAIAGVEEVIPAEHTVLVRCQRERQAAIGTLLVAIEPAADDRTRLETLVIDVVYDGADLVGVAEATGLTIDQVVELHTRPTYEVAFCGFSPGFGYLRGLDERLRLPRRPSPRPAVPAGSVGVAAGYSCVYPSASPGGWNLIGRTDVVLWDAGLDPPAELQPGRNVRFRDASR